MVTGLTREKIKNTKIKKKKQKVDEKFLKLLAF